MITALMKSYSTFIFDSYSFDPATGRIELNYGLDDEVRFTEVFTIPVGVDKSLGREVLKSGSDPKDLTTQGLKDLDAALFSLHLAAGISYYKTCIPKNIEVRSGELSEEQAKHWNTVYEKGMGQFWYENEIDFRGLVSFPVSKKSLGHEVIKTNPNDLMTKGLKDSSTPKVLLPIGGGKDSMVSLELLEEMNCDITLFRIGQHPIIDNIAKELDLPLLTIDRQLSPNLF